MAAEFVTIPVSNYVEKARWALQLAGIAFAERKYAPLLAYWSTMPKGGKSVPLLVVPASAGSSANAMVFTDSSDILNYCATKMPSLYPTPEAKALETKFDKRLGPATRCLAYYVLFQDAAAARQILAEPLGFMQRWLVQLFFPLLKFLLMRGLNVNAKTAERSWTRIEQLVADAEMRLGDGPVGSRFLADDSFSAADITFCAHMSLLLFPPQHRYISPIMSIDRIADPTYKQRLVQLQQSKAAQFVYWCYTHRRPPMLPTAKL